MVTLLIQIGQTKTSLKSNPSQPCCSQSLYQWCSCCQVLESKHYIRCFSISLTRSSLRGQPMGNQPFMLIPLQFLRQLLSLSLYHHISCYKISCGCTSLHCEGTNNGKELLNASYGNANSRFWVSSIYLSVQSFCPYLLTFSGSATCTRSWGSLSMAKQRK